MPLLRAQTGAEAVGIVLDVHTGEPLSNVAIQLIGQPYRTQSDSTGHFILLSLPSGDYVLQASTPGYHSASNKVRLDSGKTSQVELILTSDAFQRVDTVSVHSVSLFKQTDENVVGGFTLTGNDVKNLGTVLADDPLRAVQAVPGVTSNNDFEARFSVRGADPNRVGIYVDGVQLHQAVHTLEGITASGSNSIFNSGLIEQISLYDEIPPSRFGNNSAGALDVSMRDGNRDDYSFQATANFAYAGLIAEGPLGNLKQCSWISGFRKSYLQYILQQQLTDPSMSFGFQDIQGRLACRVTSRNILTFSLMEGDTGLDLSSSRIRLGPNSLMISHQKFTAANLGWQYVAGEDLLLTSHFAWSRNSFDNTDPIPEPLGSGNYSEWTWNSNAAWMWNSRNPLNTGLSVRSMRDAGYLEQYNSPTVIQVLNRYGGAGTLTSGFVEQPWTTAKGHLHLTVGGRWDRHSIDAISTFSPQAGLTLSPWSSTQIQLGWGQYAQFAEVSQFTSNLGNHGLLPIRSTQATIAIEQRIAEQLRLRATFYNRQDRDLLYQPFLDTRLINGVVFVPPANPLYENSLRGYGRGFELLLQRASGKTLTGWVSYAYGRTWMHDGATQDSFPSDYDQRHTVNSYVSYRMRPTVNLSVRWTYGSGYPLPAFVQSKAPYSVSWADVYSLGDQRNRLRVGSYQRLDLRINKSWTHSKWKTTLYGEIVNLTNRANYRFDNFEGYNSQSKLAFITLDRMFPILPSIGVTFEH
jgi:hypothetical protein